MYVTAVERSCVGVLLTTGYTVVMYVESLYLIIVGNQG